MKRHLLLLMLLAAPSTAAASALAPPADRIIKGVVLEQRIGMHLPSDLTFRDETGRRVALGQYLSGRPLILVPVWYSCPNLCNVTLQGLVDGLNAIDFRAGRDFDVVAFSIDPRDGVAEAAALERELLRGYEPRGTAAGWHLLTGTDERIRRLAAAIGFGYRYDERTGQYAHPATLVIVSGEGRVTRYLPGVEFAPRDLRLALVEAGEDELGSVVDSVLLRCFHYDPDTGRYSFAIMSVLRIVGSLMVAGIAALLTLALVRERRRSAE